ncbi:MAG: DUF1232 domain-containing protein [Candidatus Dormibacteraceae bacterium]
MGIPGVWGWLIVAAAVAMILSLVASGVVALLLRFLPEGRLRAMVILLPHTLIFCRRLLTHPAVPWRARFVLGCGLLYAASPITLIPDFIPVIGKVDNILVLIVGIRLSAAMIPAPVLIQAWPGEPRQLRLLVGRRLSKATAVIYGRQ